MVYIRIPRPRVAFCPNEFWLLPMVLAVILLIVVLAGGRPATSTAASTEAQFHAAQAHETHAADVGHWVMP